MAGSEMDASSSIAGMEGVEEENLGKELNWRKASMKLRHFISTQTQIELSQPQENPE